MNQPNIKPEKITKPIQLLAVWLASLIILVSGILTAANTIQKPTWISGFLVISAICIIPLFLLLIFLLQTKYRPEMQEDTFYSEYLDKITGTTINQIEKTKQDEIIALNLKFNSLFEITKENLERLNQQLVSTNIAPKQLEAIKEIIEETEKPFDKAENNTTYLMINKDLSNYKSVETLLTKNKFNTKGVFGNSTIPTKKLITIGTNVSPAVCARVMNLLLPLGFHSINMTNMHIHANAIMIGSYAYDYESAIIDQDLIKRFQASKTTENLFTFSPTF